MKYLRKIMLLAAMTVLLTGLIPNAIKTTLAAEEFQTFNENTTEAGSHTIPDDVDLLTATTNPSSLSVTLEWEWNYDIEDTFDDDSWDYELNGDLWDYEFYIYRSTSKDGTYTFLDSVLFYTNYYTDYNIHRGFSYYYKVVVHGYDFDGQEHYSLGTVTGPVSIPLETPIISSVTSVKGKGVKLSWWADEFVSEYNIYRSDLENGVYTKIGSVTVGSSDSLTYLDRTVKVGKTYYYKITPVVKEDGLSIEGPLSNSMSGLLEYTGTRIKKAVSKKPGTITITWKKVSDASGYIVYYSKKNSNHFKKLKTIKKNNQCTITHKKLKNGVLYNYKVYAYKNTSYGRIISDAAAYAKYCDYYTYEDEFYESKRARLFGKKGSWYKNRSIASKNMKSISVKVWDRSGGKWYSRSFYITVNKGLVPSVKKMFREIYKSKSRVPIHDIGCYNWRGNRSSSEHCIGTAFDINANENYMIEGKKILSGSFWKPKKSQYSIPLNCSLVKILRKYGFERGFWGSRKDYMHFSYFGT